MHEIGLYLSMFGGMLTLVGMIGLASVSRRGGSAPTMRYRRA